MKTLRSIALLLAGTWCGVVAAQTYPSKPIRLVVPFAPGQGGDTAARLVAQKLSDNLKQTVVADNRPGVGGNIGAEIVAKAAPDGYTLLVGSNGTHAANSALYTNLLFNPATDHVALSYIGSVAMVLLAPPAFPAAGPREVVAMAKAKPGSVSVAVPSSTARVVLELMTRTSGAVFNPISYKASATAMTDLMGGHVQLSIDTVIAAAPQVASGKLKALGVTTAKRAGNLPGAPTFAESGLPGFDLAAWNVWFAPRGTPPEIVTKLNEELRKVLGDAEVQGKLRALGYEPGGTQTAAQVGEFMRAEEKKWGDLIRAAGIKAE